MTQEQIAELLGRPYAEIVEDCANPEILRLTLSIMYQYGIEHGMTTIMNDYNAIFRGKQ